jgi:hypothetical protein
MKKNILFLVIGAFLCGQIRAVEPNSTSWYSRARGPIASFFNDVPQKNTILHTICETVRNHPWWATAAVITVTAATVVAVIDLYNEAQLTPAQKVLREWKKCVTNDLERFEQKIYHADEGGQVHLSYARLEDKILRIDNFKQPIFNDLMESHTALKDLVAQGIHLNNYLQVKKLVEQLKKLSQHIIDAQLCLARKKD